MAPVLGDVSPALFGSRLVPFWPHGWSMFNLECTIGALLWLHSYILAPFQLNCIHEKMNQQNRRGYAHRFFLLAFVYLTFTWLTPLKFACSANAAFFLCFQAFPISLSFGSGAKMMPT